MKLISSEFEILDLQQAAIDAALNAIPRAYGKICDVSDSTSVDAVFARI